MLGDRFAGDDWTLIHGDSCEELPQLDADSVDLSVYSPPFASVYTYSATERDIGNSSTHEEFVDHLGYVIRELIRVTKPGRLSCCHIAQITTQKARDGVIGLVDMRGMIIKAFLEAGWIYHGDICIDKDPQAQAIRTHSKALLFVQLNEDWIEWARPIWYGLRESDTLNAAAGRENEDERHICPLQLGTIERCIRLWSNPGELVLSPFAGIGSEGYEAIRLGRKYLGIELKESYARTAVKNLQTAEGVRAQGSLFATVPD